MDKLVKAFLWTWLHWTLVIHAQTMRGPYELYAGQEEVLNAENGSGFDDSGGENDHHLDSSPTYSFEESDHEEEPRLDHGEDPEHGGEFKGTDTSHDEGDFSGWMWISAFSILAFGGAGLIFMVAKETIKYCRHCQEREAGMARVQSLRQDLNGRVSAPGSPMGARSFGSNVVLSAFSGRR